MLGNGAQRQTVTVVVGDPYTVPILGGMTALSVVVGGPGDAKFKPTAEITMQAVALLKVTVPKQDTKANQYRITVFDNAGASRWFDVTVAQQ